METLDVYAIAKNVLDSLSTKASQRQIRLQLIGQSTMMFGNPALIHSFCTIFVIMLLLIIVIREALK